MPWCYSELGMKYGVYFDDNNYYTSLQAGREAKWFGGWLRSAVQLPFALTLGGLNIKIRLDF